MTPPPRPSGRAAPAAAPFSAQRMRIGLGTFVIIEGCGADEACVHSAIEAGFAAIAAVGRDMHPEDPASDVARINAAAPGAAVAVRAGTFTVLRFAQHLHRLSAGSFDPCLPGPPGRLGDLELLAGAIPAVRSAARVRLDLGGIAKGFAVDCAVGALLRAGCSAGLVNAGGDLRVFGPACQTILLKRTDGSHRPVTLRQAALAVSERDGQRAPSGHRGYYLRTRTTSGAVRYAAVRAPDAMTADALTKCVLLCPRAASRALLRQFGAENLS